MHWIAGIPRLSIPLSSISPDWLTPEQLAELLFRYGIRDLRAIGHKAIAVQNVHRLLPLVGP